MGMLIDIKGITKAYGPRAILENASTTFSEGQKIAVIGRNGAGKSTLCRILTGEEEADSGTIWRASNLRLSYLQQHDPYRLDETVHDFLVRFTEQPEWLCAKVASRFQLKGAILDAPVGSLSGGYRTRVKLASMLLTEPNFILLDEPTNYLDLKTLILLERFLLEYDGGFIVVSHDREFLKRTCDSTLEVEGGGLTLFPGTVEEFLTFKDEQKEQAIAYNQNIEAKQRQLKAFVDRFKAKASKASQARSKMKQLQRMKTIQIDHPMKNVRIRIPAVPKRHGIALRCEGLEIGYPDKCVAKKIHVEVPQGARVAVLGDNGQGKTTFLRTIAGDLDPRAGSFRWGHALTVGYYAQHVYSSLESTMTVRSYLQKRAAKDVLDQEILDMAGSFLFQGADVEKKIAVLSGGERARMVLAGLLLAKNPVLLLDEPSNHLDFETVEALATALKKYSGTLFFVSHDRTFVHIVATEIIEVADGNVVRYPGTYDEYVYRLQTQLNDEIDRDEAEEAGAASGGAASTKPEVAPPLTGRAAHEARKAAENAAKRRERRNKELEVRITALQKERDEILAALDNAADPRAVELSERYDVVQTDLTKAEEEWAGMQEGD
jgi:ATP-binding cassette subfamily F protein 3